MGVEDQNKLRNVRSPTILVSVSGKLAIVAAVVVAVIEDAILVVSYRIMVFLSRHQYQKVYCFLVLSSLLPATPLLLLSVCICRLFAAAAALLARLSSRHRRQKLTPMRPTGASGGPHLLRERSFPRRRVRNLPPQPPPLPPLPLRPTFLSTLPCHQ